MKPLKMEKPKLPDNNRIPSCRHLDVFSPQLGLQLPALRIYVGQAFIFSTWSFSTTSYSINVPQNASY